MEWLWLVHFTYQVSFENKLCFCRAFPHKEIYSFREPVATLYIRYNLDFAFTLNLSRIYAHAHLHIQAHAHIRTGNRIWFVRNFDHHDDLSKIRNLWVCTRPTGQTDRHTNTHTHTHTHTRTHTCTCTHKYTHTHTEIHTCTHTHAHTRAYTHTHAPARTHTSSHAHTHL